MSIFISHVEENRATAEAIVRGLQSAGYKAWSYELSSVPGPTYLLQVVNAIEQASAVILIISPHALGSHQVAREIEAAHELDRPIIPVLQDITHEKYLQRRPEWRLALGAYTSIEVPREGVDAIMHKIVGGLQAFGVEPGEPSPPPPPPGYALPAPGYPGTAGGGGHKLGAGLIAAIIAAVVVIAGGVTATILLTDNSSHDPPQPVNPSVLIGPSSQTPSPTTTTPSPTATTSPGGGIPLGSHGVSLTPAPGWTIYTQDPDYAILDSGDQGPSISVSVRAAQSTDITQVLSADMKDMISGNAIQVGPMSTPSTYQGQNFNLRVSASYQGTMSTQQSTFPIFGVCTELLNTSTGQSAFIDYYSVDSAASLTAHAAEADSMINSMH